MINHAGLLRWSLGYKMKAPKRVLKHRTSKIEQNENPGLGLHHLSRLTKTRQLRIVLNYPQTEFEEIKKSYSLPFEPSLQSRHS